MWQFGYFGYPTVNITFDGFILRGDPARLNALSALTGLTNGDYWAGGTTTLTNMDVRGTWQSIYGWTNVHGTLNIMNSHFRSFIAAIVMVPPSTPGTGTGSGDQVWNIGNCTYTQWGSDPGYYDLSASYSLAAAKTNLRVLQQCNVTDHKGVPGDNFRLYYAEQVGTFIMPQTGTPPEVMVGCPEAGLTNAQAYVKYHEDGTLKVPAGSLSDPEGCAIAGAVAPGGAHSRSGIFGLVSP
jgi:hypothetical protein